MYRCFVVLVFGKHGCDEAAELCSDLSYRSVQDRLCCWASGSLHSSSDYQKDCVIVSVKTIFMPSFQLTAQLALSGNHLAGLQTTFSSTSLLFEESHVQNIYGSAQACLTLWLRMIHASPRLF